MTTYWRPPVLIQALLMAGSAAAQPRPVQSAPSSTIAVGKPFWVDSDSDVDSWLNARVDIGTLRQEGDEIEARIWWPFAPGYRIDYRTSHPELTIPEGSRLVYRERVACRPAGPLRFALSYTLVAPDGTLIYRRECDAAEERRKAAEGFRTRSSAAGFSSDPVSLICRAGPRRASARASPSPGRHHRIARRWSIPSEPSG